MRLKILCLDGDATPGFEDSAKKEFQTGNQHASASLVLDSNPTSGAE